MFYWILNTYLLWLCNHPQISSKISFSKNRNDNSSQCKTFQIIRNSKKAQKLHHNESFFLFLQDFFGQCPCKSNVKQRDCSICKDGYYDLRNDDLTGCKCKLHIPVPRNLCSTIFKINKKVPNRLHRLPFSLFNVDFEHVSSLTITVYVWMIFSQDINMLQ